MSSLWKGLWNRSWNTWVTFLIAWPEQVSVSAWHKWRFTGFKRNYFQSGGTSTCSGIDSSPRTLTCEKMFEHPKAKAVTGPQTPNTGQQVYPSNRDTDIPSSNNFPKETRNLSCILVWNPIPWAWWLSSPQKLKDSAVTEETRIYTPKDPDQVTASHCVIWNLAG